MINAYLGLAISIFLWYIVLALFNHYEPMFYGGKVLIPSWLCVFCLYEWIKKKLQWK